MCVAALICIKVQEVPFLRHLFEISCFLNEIVSELDDKMPFPAMAVTGDVVLFTGLRCFHFCDIRKAIVDTYNLKLQHFYAFLCYQLHFNRNILPLSH